MNRPRNLTILALSLVLVGSLAALACGEKEEPAEETSMAEEAPSIDVVGLTVGRAIGPDRKVTDETDTFAPGDTIYASVETEGTAGATLVARWTFEDGQVVDESSRSIAPNGPEVTEFHVSKPDGWPTGHYEVTIRLNGEQAEQAGFDVEAGG